MGYKEIYNGWLNEPYFDEGFKKELADLTDEKEIEDRFYKDLEFGTAGMRGIIGAGRNRINKYIVRKASQGFANYLLNQFQNQKQCTFWFEYFIKYVVCNY